MYATVTGPVRLAMAVPVVSIDPATTLRGVARELEHEDIGAVVVLGRSGLAGLLSERDIVRALARGADPDAISVDRVMAEDPLSVGADTPIAEVADLMRDTGVRHLPVVAGDDVVGMVSMRDVLDVIRREQTARRDDRWTARGDEEHDVSPSNPRATERLRAEHASLRRDAARLPRVAASLSEWTAPDTPDQLQQVRGFLVGRLLPHAASEEAVLYPLLDKVMGAEQSTATMVADHAEIHERSDALAGLVAAVGTGPPSPAEAEALREHLYGLWAIVRLHLDKEEKILFSLLDARLSSADVQTLERKMAAFSGHAPG